MAIALIAPGKNNLDFWKQGLEAEFRRLGLQVPVEIGPEVRDPERIKSVIVWKHEPEWLYRFPNLQLISSMGAGVDHILKDKNLPKEWKVVRIVDPTLTQSMSNYLLAGVLNYHKKLLDYLEKQEKREWAYTEQPERNVHVGVLGFGELGTDIAEKLVKLNFKVSGYSNSRKDLAGVKSYAGEQELGDFLQEVNLLICLLPLTKKTRGFLNRELFKRCQAGTYLINVARGAHLVEEDLLEALQEGWVSGAMLDVFQQEPLPAEHPFWGNPGIIITPHIASVTIPNSAIPQIAENYRRMLEGEKLNNQIDREKGY